MMLTESPMVYAGGGFPWGLLIVGGIVYFVWRSGMFGGPGRHGNGPRYGGGYGSGYSPAQMPEAPGPEQGSGPGFGPRTVFEDWHRQAHEAAGAQPQTPAVPQAYAAPSAPPAPPAAPATETPASGDGEPAR